MSFSTAIRHNQSLVIAAIISIISFGGIAACQLTQPQKEAIADTSKGIIDAVVQKTPLPWAQIGLTIGTILGSGAIVDNRRKDVLIKTLQSKNADLTEKLANAEPPIPPTPLARQPLCNN